MGIEQIDQSVSLVDIFARNIHLIAAITVTLYGMAITCAIREVMYSRTSQGTIAWLLSLIFFPFPTVFIYLILGWKRFDDYVDIQRFSGRFEREAYARDLKLSDNEASDAWPVLTKVSHLPFLRGNDVKLLIDGDATFDSILSGVRNAQRSICVQFFIVRDDGLGRRLADALIERANAGVKVFFLYDDIGSKSLSNSYIEKLSAAGIQVSGFNNRHKMLRLLGPMRLNYRNHRKIVVVDAETAWVGGHNVGDEYLGLDPHLGHWRDTHVRVQGPAAIACALSFAEDWHWATGDPLEMDVPEEFSTPGDQSVLVMPTGPADTLEDCSIAFTEVISRARKRLWIVSPYFVPGMDVVTALYAAAMRGVDVRILLPEKADHRLVWLASHAHADDMLGHGIKVFRYQNGFLHQKVVLMDDELTSVGTVNFDNRSFRINFEITLWFTCERMIKQVSDMLEKDFENARQSEPNELDQRAYAFRVLAQGARIFSPIL